MRTITLEEHFVSPAFVEWPGKGIRDQANNLENPMARVIEQLTDLGGRRIAARDAAGIDVQVLSLNSPGVEQLEPAGAVMPAKPTISSPRRRNAVRAVLPDLRPCRPRLQANPPGNYVSSCPSQKRCFAHRNEQPQSLSRGAINKRSMGTDLRGPGSFLR